MAHNKRVGKLGEELAESYLKDKGYFIRERNFRFRRVEIDIIAELQQQLVFVEVKTRSNTLFGFPETAVGMAKMDSIYQCAEAYLKTKSWSGAIRFDIIAVVLETPVEIMHFVDAF